MEKKFSSRNQTTFSQVPPQPLPKFSSSGNSQFSNRNTQSDVGKPKGRGKHQHGLCSDRDGHNRTGASGGHGGRGGSKGYQRRTSSNQQSNEVSRAGKLQGQFPQQACKPGSEKTSRHGADASHLLNFTYSPVRSQSGGSSGSHGLPYRRTRSKRQPIHTKEQFLQAHCQFVVRKPVAELEYLEYLTDCDSMVKWEDIEEVIMNNEEQVASCPICLERPVAAKITKCAHIYCWPCMLCCLSYSEKSWAKCPVCSDSVEDKDLKSVVIKWVKKPKVGDEITFYLMKREREALYVRPTSTWKDASSGRLFDVMGDADDVKYSKLLSATAEDIERVVSRERRELLQLMDRKDTTPLESQHIQAALNRLTERSQKLSSVMQYPSSAATASTCVAPVQQTPVPTVRSDPNLKTINYVDAFDEELSITPDTKHFPEQEVKLSIDDLPKATGVSSKATDESPKATETSDVITGSITSSRMRTESSTSSCDSHETEQLACNLLLPATGTQPARSTGSKRTEVYYFYQAADGQHVYLHSVNTRILAAHYKSLEMAPTTLTVTIVECEENSMTSELRRKLKYLSHLPLYSQFMVCEVALRPPIVSSNCLANFREELANRKRLRSRRQRAEAKHHSRIQAEERCRMGKYPDMALPLSSDKEFPDSISSASAGVAGGMSEVDTGYVVSEANSASFGEAALTPGRQNGIPLTTPYSFAQAMASGSSAPALWPRISTGGNYVRSKGPQTELTLGDQSSNDSNGGGEDELVSAPSFQQSFSADFDQMVLNATTAYKKEESTSGEAKSKGKQKKKKKAVMLFSTSGQRSNQ